MYPLEKMKIPPQIEGDVDDIPPAAHGFMSGQLLNETEEGRRGMWQAYYASVTFMDEQLGKVLDELDRQGLSDSTAIFFHDGPWIPPGGAWFLAEIQSS